MDPLEIHAGWLLSQLLAVVTVIGIPVISLIDLARKKLTGTPLAPWLLVIRTDPLPGSPAHWIVRPTVETKI